MEILGGFFSLSSAPRTPSQELESVGGRQGNGIGMERAEKDSKFRNWEAAAREPRRVEEEAERQSGSDQSELAALHEFYVQARWCSAAAAGSGWVRRRGGAFRSSGGGRLPCRVRENFVVGVTWWG
jgi:hypothetical protein